MNAMTPSVVGRVWDVNKSYTDMWWLRATLVKLNMRVDLLSWRWSLLWHSWWNNPVAFSLSQELVNKFMTKYGGPVPLMCDMRTEFRRMLIATPGKGDGTHTHQVSAANRAVASAAMAKFAALRVMTPYYYQKSSTDVKYGYDGCRTWYWSKDLHIPRSQDEFTPDHLLCMVDVDEYLDLNDVLTHVCQPIMIYTFQPSQPGGVRSDYVFSSRGTLFKYRVHGGGEYEHPVWDFGLDSLLTKSRVGNFVRHASWHVERRQVDEDHMLILLVPSYIWYSYYDMTGIAGKCLKHLNFSMGDFQVAMSVGVNKTTSIARADSTLCATLQTTALEGLFSLNRAQSIGITLAAVTKHAPGLSDGEVALVLEYVRATSEHLPYVVYPLDMASRGFSFQLSTYDVEDKNSMVSFMSPFVNEAFNPVQNKSNEEKAAKERVTDIASDVKFPARFDRYATDFIQSFPRGCLIPCDEAEVWERQNRPSQRRILQLAYMAVDSRTTQTFMKKECYDKPKPPRQISTITPTSKLEYSRHQYPVQDLLEAQDWYAFGKTPLSIASCVASICQHAEQVMGTDLSRMDGRVSPAAREFERRFMTWVYDNKYHAEMIHLMESQTGLKAYGRFGVKYNTGTARASGSPETATFNTLLNKFMAYCHFRDRGFQHDAAMRAPGIYGGDDGLTADADPKVYVTTVAAFGQVLTPEIFLRGCAGVNFLARYYSPNVWFGDNNSMCDLRRQLSKFHVTVALPPNITAMDKLIEKSRAFALSDRNTPVIGDYVSLVVGMTAGTLLPSNPELNSIGPYLNKRSLSHEQYSNAYGCWMMDHVNLYCEDLDLSVFYAWIEDARTKPVDNLLRPPLLGKPEGQPPLDGVIVDGQYHTQPKRVVRRGRRGGAKH